MATASAADTPLEAQAAGAVVFRITDYADRLLDDLDSDRMARAREDDAAQLDRPFATAPR